MGTMQEINSLGETIRQARTRARLTLRQLSAQAAVTPSYISDIEHDRRIPAEAVVRRFAELLKIDPDDLMARAGRIGDAAERYLKQHPAAGLLLRRITSKKLGDAELQRLLRIVEKL
jgi:transcriptional regulator with XRE-family HTH domain